MRKSSNLEKSLLIALFFSAAGALIAYSIQSQANKAVNACSYLDPIAVDIAALVFGLFLVIEGLIDIYKHAKSLVRQQVLRCMRVGFGVSILTIHIMQFLHK